MYKLPVYKIKERSNFFTLSPKHKVSPRNYARIRWPPKNAAQVVFAQYRGFILNSSVYAICAKHLLWVWVRVPILRLRCNESE